MRTLWHRVARASIGAVILSVALAGVALADTEMGHGGLVGEHRLRDVPGYPGGLCYYEGDLSTGAIGPLHRMTARAPVVFARDSSPEEDLQWVGYRLRLQREVFEGEDDPFGPWQTVQVRAIQKRIATDVRPAEFRRQSFAIDSPGRDRFRIVVDMYWFNADGTRIVGGAAHVVDNHRVFVGGEFFLDQARPCHDAQ